MVAAELKIYRDESDARSVVHELARTQSDSQSASKSGFDAGSILFKSERMRQAVEQATRFATSSATVLLNGESGTGKELFASLIHSCSHRSDKVFARINCAALTETLIESELFGHEKGAFTGADASRTGRFEWADGGTLLLDEISEVPLAIQAKLLRVLEENEFQRVGCNTTRRVNVRVIASSNRDLQAEVAAKRFRGDLYHRLNVLQVSIPALRSRAEDIPLLADRFMQNYRFDSKSPLTGIDPAALSRLTDHSWPGNVRELRNTIHRACVLATGSRISADDLPVFEEPPTEMPAWIMEETLDGIERRVILESLRKFGWNKTRAAEHLGVTARTLSNKLKTYEARRLMPKAA